MILCLSLRRDRICCDRLILLGHLVDKALAFLVLVYQSPHVCLHFGLQELPPLDFLLQLLDFAL